MVLRHICSWQYNIRLTYRKKWRQNTQVLHIIFFSVQKFYLAAILDVMFIFRKHFRYVIYQATSNVWFYSQMWQIETSIQVLDLSEQVVTYIWRPFWKPSWISHNAQWCQGGINQILEVQGLGYKNQSRKKVWTLFPGPDKIPHKSARLSQTVLKWGMRRIQGHVSSKKTSGKHVCVINTTYTKLSESKTGVCKGIPIFLIFDLKHRLWVLVRNASPRRF